jgi:hypothetical protein
MSRLSRAMWRLVPQRLLFRPNGEITRLGYWSFHRVMRKMPKGKFITVAESHAIMAENHRIHAEHIARGLSRDYDRDPVTPEEAKALDERYPDYVEWKYEPPANAVALTSVLQCPVHGEVFVTVDYELAIVTCLTCGRPVEEVKPIHTD